MESIARKLQNFKNLTIIGTQNLADIGKVNHKLLKELQKFEFLTGDPEAVTQINQLFQKFRNTIKHHKTYLNYINDLTNINISLQEKINLLTPNFTILEEEFLTLKTNIQDFIVKHEFKINSDNTLEMTEKLQNNTKTGVGVSSDQAQITKKLRSDIETGVGASIDKAQIVQSESFFVANNILINQPILQINIPLPITKKLNFYNFFKKEMSIKIQPELEFNYLKNIKSEKKFFIGINFDISFNVVNLKKIKTKEINILTIKSFNTVGKVRSFSHNKIQYFTFSVGKNNIIKNKECEFLINFPLRKENFMFQKRNVSFEFNYKNSKYFIVSNFENNYLRFKPIFSYEIFPFNSEFKQECLHKLIVQPEVQNNNLVQKTNNAVDIVEETLNCAPDKTYLLAETADIVEETSNHASDMTFTASVAFPTPVFSTSKKTPLFSIPALLVLLPLLVGTGFFFWKNNRNK